jgi:leucine dehydrogenase
MDIFNYADELEYGELHVKVEPEIGLRAVVAIHSLQLGPAIGGCRFNEYDTSEDALRDVMRLGRGMTYKAAIVGLPHGGAKSVVIRPPNLTDKQRRRMFQEFGEFVDSLGGDYITAEDVGTTVDDMDLIHQQTDHVLGRGTEEGGAGDPSPHTATGVRRGIEAAVRYRYGHDSLEGLTVAIQGVGHVGYYLAGELDERGANLVVTDIDEQAMHRCVEEFGAETVDPEAIFDVECDVFAPCALGAVLDDDTIPRLECDIVAGSANNQLAAARHDSQLRERDILYAPDYLINAGGLIYVAAFYNENNIDQASDKISGIHDQLLEVFERADTDDMPTQHVTDRIVEERLEI